VKLSICDDQCWNGGWKAGTLDGEEPFYEEHHEKLAVLYISLSFVTGLLFPFFPLFFVIVGHRKESVE